jgi:hypothetical protein
VARILNKALLVAAKTSSEKNFRQAAGRMRYRHAKKWFDLKRKQEEKGTIPWDG